VPEACSLCVTRMAQVTRTTECIRARIHSHACVYKPLKAARSLVVSLKILWRKEERSFKAIRVGVNILHASIRTDGWTARYVNADPRVIHPSPILFDKNHLPLRNCENCEAFHTFRTFLSWCKNLHATNCQIILYVYKTFHEMSSLYVLSYIFFLPFLRICAYTCVCDSDRVAHQYQWKLYSIPFETKSHISTPSPRQKFHKTFPDIPNALYPNLSPTYVNNLHLSDFFLVKSLSRKITNFSVKKKRRKTIRHKQI